MLLSLACAPTPPDIVLVSLDTTRADGIDATTTPNIWAIAQRGVRFERAYTHAPTTLSSHASAKAAGEDTVSRVSVPVRTPGETVVAVLPLDDYSERPDHFGDGMTEALITDLSQSGQLRVISRTSSLHFKKRGMPLTEVANQLGADYVVEGSVIRAAGRVRVTAQLIDARTDEHVWARSYDRPVTDALGVQAEVAGIIANEVTGKLSQPAAAQVARK